MNVTIQAFPNEGMIPKVYTADGADTSPAISWSAPPAGTQCFALIMDDPDAPAGLWTHWTIYNIPGTTTKLTENIPRTASLPDGSKQGRNTWGRLGYNGPSPPPGKPHRYYVHVFALSGPLDLPAGATREELDRGLKGKILTEGVFMAKYGR